MGDGLKRAREAARQTRVQRLPRVGDVWADNDPRSAGRTLRVEAIEGDKAVCVLLTNSNTTQGLLDSWARKPLGQQGYACPDARDMRGKTTRISLSRFKPTSTGYRLSEGGD